MKRIVTAVSDKKEPSLSAEGSSSAAPVLTVRPTSTSTAEGEGALWLVGKPGDEDADQDRERDPAQGCSSFQHGGCEARVRGDSLERDKCECSEHERGGSQRKSQLRMPSVGCGWGGTGPRGCGRDCRGGEAGRWGSGRGGWGRPRGMAFPQ